MADFAKECFFIAPIGEEDTDVRKRSDAVKDWIVKPAAEIHGLETVRGDDVGEPGQITSQAVQHCLKAKAAVADLTGGNPNVYYELSVRHGAQLPVVLIAERGPKLPFDMSQSRVIFFDHTDLADAGKARIELEEQIGESLTAPPSNPIADGMRLAELKAGNTEEKTLAALAEQVGRIAATVERLDARTSPEVRLIDEAQLRAYRPQLSRKPTKWSDRISLERSLTPTEEELLRRIAREFEPSSEQARDDDPDAAPESPVK